MMNREYKKPSLRIVILDASTPLNAGSNEATGENQSWSAKRGVLSDECFEDDDEE